MPQMHMQESVLTVLLELAFLYGAISVVMIGVSMFIDWLRNY